MAHVRCVSRVETHDTRFLSPVSKRGFGSLASLLVTNLPARRGNDSFIVAAPARSLLKLPISTYARYPRMKWCWVLGRMYTVVGVWPEPYNGIDTASLPIRG